METYIGMAEGIGTGVKMTEALSEVREAAIARNVVEIYLRFDLRQLVQGEYRFAKIAERVLKIIHGWEI